MKDGMVIKPKTDGIGMIQDLEFQSMMKAEK